MTVEVDWSLPPALVPADVSGHLDLRNVYVIRAYELAATSKPGIERFAYRLFGPDIMGSLAFALDPYKKIRLPTHAITPANRTVKLACIPYRTRKHHGRVVLRDTRNAVDTSTPELDVTPVKTVWSETDKGTITGTPQDAVFGSRSDTTIRTRGPGSPYGTFELWAPYTSIPPRSNSWRKEEKTTSWYYTGWLVIDQEWFTHNDGIGPGIRWSKASVDALKAPEIAFASTMKQKHGMELLRRATPVRSRFQGFYNVAELKDLPLLLRNAVELYRHPFDSLTTFKGAGNQYLNYQFGWQSTLQAIRQMLALPQKIVKEVNYLISRQGKATTYRSSFKSVDRLSSVPNFTYDVYSGETVKSTGTSSVREWELRCVLNYDIVLPNVDLPILRGDLLEKAWGVQPRPKDVYELIPWTWLVDWFTGLGDYINLLDTIYSDQNLFNYGFLTYSSECKITGLLHTQVTESSSTQYAPAARVTETWKKDFRYSGLLGYRYQSRTDISELPNMRSLSRPITLSDEQKTIIGALLTKFAGN